ncbi:MAG TPA: hypothetical protein PKG95_13715, partial [Anaerolineaceae bacterium]|nr:hypothetical protein [Anaerolineaceae bacterium]
FDFYNYTDTSATTDNYIRYNRLHNILPAQYGVGVLVYNNFYAEISDNVMTAVRVGVQTGNYSRANPGTTAAISNNSIETSKRGIFHNLAYSNASPFTISGNTFTVLDAPTETRWDAIMLSSLQGSVNAIVMDNVITVADVTQPTVGYQIWNTPTTALLAISGGSVSGADYGVWVNNYDGYGSNADDTSITLVGVQISDASLAGVYVLDNPAEADGDPVTATLLNGVVLDNCTTGIWASGPQATVISSGNLIQNNTTGALVEGDAVVTIANNSLTGNTTAITNTGALLVNASSNWYGTAEAAAVAGLVSAGVDYTPWLNSGTDTGAAAGFQGDFTYLNVDDDSPQAGSVGRIQEGVNLATAGGTVYVWAGTYPEQVTITKDLALLGEDQATTIIQAFANMPVCFTTAAANRPIVCVMDAVATIDGFTIDGLGLGNSNNRFEGVALRNAGGTIQNNIIRDIRDEPFSGAQHGVAVYAYNTNGTPYTIHVLDNVITGFQKTAIALNTDAVTPETVDIQRNTITGAGATTVTAQNGIQVWSEPGSGLVADNTISGIAYDGLNWVATSILNYYADLDITGNTVTDAHLAIYNIDGGGLIADNDLTIIKTATYPYAYGIVATDPPQAIPSPFDPQARPDNQLTGNGTNALLGVEVANNVVTFNGTDKTGTTAIEADAAYGPNDLALNVHDNIVTGFEYGLVFYQCDPATSTTCDTGVFTAISANHNDLVGNAMGIYLGGPIPAAVVPTIHHNRIFGDGAVGLYNDLAVSVTAENNWWGCNEGPSTVAVPTDCDSIEGLVDADPWLMLSSTFEPLAMVVGGEGTLDADLIFNSAAADTSADGFVPDTTPAVFTATNGTFAPAAGTFLSGIT